MNKSEIIEINAKLETKDYWESYFSHYFNFNNLLLNFLSFTIFGWTISFLFLRDKFEIPHIIDVMLAAGFFTFFTSFIWTYLAVSHAKNIGGHNCKYIITDDKVEVFAESFSSSINWKYFQRVKETGKHFILLSKDGRRLLLPKREFREEEIIEFKNLIRTKFGNEAYLKKAKGNLGLK